MKLTKQTLAAFFAIVVIMVLIGCGSSPSSSSPSGPRATTVVLEHTGSSMGIDHPDWIRTYLAQGISGVQALSRFRDRYCIIGQESGVNKQFVITWADNFSAQQRIGAMLRTNIESLYQARVQGAAESQGGAQTSGGTASGAYRQEIDSSINAVVNVSYSGAQREADWWILNRRYDPDIKDAYSDEYTAYVLYTIPKNQLNQQIADALATSVAADSVLYDITIELARQILTNGLTDWGQE